jgi:uncharacterized phiE125 gp8 family phage protein
VYWKCTTQPSAEPVALAEAKLFLVEESTDRDALIRRLIVSARRIVEHRTKRQLMAATWTGVADHFPHVGRFTNPADVDRLDERRGHAYFPAERLILIDVAPIQAINSIAYLDQDGHAATLTSDGYQSDLVSEPARLAPSVGSCWPATQCGAINAVTIAIKAGYSISDGSESDQRAAVPQEAKDAILFLVDGWYNAPETLGRVESSREAEFASIIEPLIWDLV